MDKLTQYKYKDQIKMIEKKLLNYEMDETQQLHEQYFRFPIM